MFEGTGEKKGVIEALPIKKQQKGRWGVRKKQLARWKRKKNRGGGKEKRLFREGPKKNLQEKLDPPDEGNLRIYCKKKEMIR